jgi:hypothetical protein
LCNKNDSQEEKKMQIKQLKAIPSAANDLADVNEFLKTIPAEKVVSVQFTQLPYPNNPSQYCTVAVITYLADLCERNT